MKNYFEKSAVVPKKDDFVKCSDLMSQVEDMAPSDSNVYARVNQTTDGSFHTIISINASCGRFYAEAKTSTFVSSLKSAQNGILKKLDHWKSIRFSLMQEQRSF